jgi:flagellar basal-body rod modification protein FlgD
VSTISPNSTTTPPSTTSSSASSGSTSQSGFGSLTTTDFMQMLIAELQNQDPTQPMSSEDLLSQLTTMSQLQSTTELDSSLQANTTNQQLSIGASFIGKSINGTDDSGKAVSGVVDQAFLQNGTAYVGVGNSQVQLSNITDVAAASS